MGRILGWGVRIKGGNLHPRCLIPVGKKKLGLSFRGNFPPGGIHILLHLPPTQDTLVHYTNRRIYQASLWIASLKSQQNVPKPETFDWIGTDNTWKPIWITLPEATKSCRELIKCGCKAEPLCSRKCMQKCSAGMYFSLSLQWKLWTLKYLNYTSKPILVCHFV